jgi:hypothetical protein
MSKTSRLFLTETQEQYLEWLLQPVDSRNPKTKKEWAEQHGIHYNTVGQWEKNKNFQERWNLGVKGLAQSPERAQALLDALFIKGIAGDTKSAELYLKATNQMPNAAQQINIKSETSIKELTDDELHSMILELSQKKQPTITISKKEEEEDY